MERELDKRLQKLGLQVVEGVTAATEDDCLFLAAIHRISTFARTPSLTNRNIPWCVTEEGTVQGSVQPVLGTGECPVANTTFAMFKVCATSSPWQLRSMPASLLTVRTLSAIYVTVSERVCHHPIWRRGWIHSLMKHLSWCKSPSGGRS